MPQKNLLILTGYIFYGLIVFLISAYLRFPSREFLEVFLTEAHKMTGAYHLTAKDMRLSLLPLGATLVEGAISRADSPEKPLLQFTHLTVTSNILTGATERRLPINLKMKAYGGIMEAHFLIDDKETFHGQYVVNFSGMELGAMNALGEALGRKLQGKISGDIQFNGEPSRALSGSAEALFTLNAGVIELLQPILGFHELAYDALQMRLRLASGDVEIQDCTMLGNILDGAINGNITPAADIFASTLHLKGSFTPHEKMIAAGGSLAQILKSRLRDGKLFFNVSGTLAEPFFEPL